MSSENLSSTDMSDSIFRTITGGAENAAGVPADISQAAANVIRNNVENNLIKPALNTQLMNYRSKLKILECLYIYLVLYN